MLTTSRYSYPDCEYIGAVISPVDKMFWKNLFCRFALFSGSIIIALAAAESLVRILGVEDAAQEVCFPPPVDGQIPGSARVGSGYQYAISSNRRLVYLPATPPELPPRKSPDELRILCLGDSIIDNTWRRYLTRFPALLEEKIVNNPIPPWTSCTVVNAGVTGYNPVQYYDTTKSDGATATST